MIYITIKEVIGDKSETEYEAIPHSKLPEEFKKYYINSNTIDELYRHLADNGFIPVTDLLFYKA